MPEQKSDIIKIAEEQEERLLANIKEECWVFLVDAARQMGGSITFQLPLSLGDIYEVKTDPVKETLTITCKGRIRRQ